MVASCSRNVRGARRAEPEQCRGSSGAPSKMVRAPVRWGIQTPMLAVCLALSRRKQGFESPRERQQYQQLSFGEREASAAVRKLYGIGTPGDLRSLRTSRRAIAESSANHHMQSAARLAQATRRANGVCRTRPSVELPITRRGRAECGVSYIWRTPRACRRHSHEWARHARIAPLVRGVVLGLGVDIFGPRRIVLEGWDRSNARSVRAEAVDHGPAILAD